MLKTTKNPNARGNNTVQRPKQQQQQQKPRRRARQAIDMTTSFSTSLQGLAVSNATSLRNMQQPPGGVRLHRTEYLMDINGSTSAFAIAATVPINPALPFFTWLCNIARNYEAYKFTRLKFAYVNRTTSAATGYVVLAIDFDPSEAAPMSKQQLMGNNSVSTVPSANITYIANSVDLNRLSRFLCRTSAISGDLSTYDLGQLYVGVGGCLTNGNIGELWVEYEVHFYTPQVESGALVNARSNSVFNSLVNTVLASGVPLTLPFGNTVFNPGGFLNAAGVFTGPSGAYLVYAQQTVSTTTTLTILQLLFLKNGVVFGAAFGAALTGAGSSTVNGEFVVSLIAGDTLAIQVSATGTGTLTAVAGGPTGAGNTLVIVAA